MVTLSGTRLEALLDYLDGLTGRPDTRELADMLRNTDVSIEDVAKWVAGERGVKLDADLSKATAEASPVAAAVGQEEESDAKDLPF